MTNKLTVLAAAVAIALSAQTVKAEVSAAEAEKLKGELTPLGAEKAGNKDGTIPAWDGGYTTIPAGWTPGSPRPDPFAGEKPRITVTAANAEQYKAQLTDGQMALLKKYPDYRMDVYPTHRSHAAPQWVYDNTFANAMRAKLTDNGYGMEGAYGGVPFPIPKDAYEIFWNHRTAWQGGPGVEYKLSTFVVTADGNRALASQGPEALSFPYYRKDGSLETFKGYYQLGTFIAENPSYKVGEAILANEPVDYTKQPRVIYQYLVGQRRVRKAPSVAYDTPDFVTSGIGYFDEAFGLFGPIDHHELKLIGKQEKLIPYNSNGTALATVDQLVTPKFLNPDHVRWELHRVWVVEATLKSGKRHVVPKRRYYIDEDNWQITLFDGWDAQGELWRTSFNLGLLCYDGPGYVATLQWGGYNLQTGAYFLNSALNEQKVQYRIAPDGLPDSQFTPDAIASGVR